MKRIKHDWWQKCAFSVCTNSIRLMLQIMQSPWKTLYGSKHFYLNNFIKCCNKGLFYQINVQIMLKLQNHLKSLRLYRYTFQNNWVAVREVAVTFICIYTQFQYEFCCKTLINSQERLHPERSTSSATCPQVTTRHNLPTFMCKIVETFCVIC